jgi:hypothetical protein
MTAKTKPDGSPALADPQRGVTGRPPRGRAAEAVVAGREAPAWVFPKKPAVVRLDDAPVRNLPAAASV